MTQPLEGTPRAGTASVAAPVGEPIVLTGNGGTGMRADRLTYRQAREAPCLTCQTSPCCTHLAISDFPLENLMAVDQAFYLLNFEGIIAGLDRSWKVQIYLQQACRYLGPESGLCTVHSTPLQPPICVQYNAQSCGYRHRMTVEVDSERPLVDAERMAWVADHLVFDDERRVVATPAWEEMLEAFRSMPLHRQRAPVPEPDPVLQEWREIILSEKGSEAAPRSVHHFGDAQVTNPCQGCEAYCCKVLVFNRGLPIEASQLEFLRYCLGFPAVEVGVADDGWALIVHTRCRHLDGNRCSVFGTDERPLQCSYYDAVGCGYRGHFGTPRPEDILRIRREHFELVADSLVFDNVGRVVAIPPVAVLRDRLEDHERQQAMSMANVMMMEVSD